MTFPCTNPAITAELCLEGDSDGFYKIAGQQTQSKLPVDAARRLAVAILQRAYVAICHPAAVQFARLLLVYCAIPADSVHPVASTTVVAASAVNAFASATLVPARQEHLREKHSPGSAVATTTLEDSRVRTH